MTEENLYPLDVFVFWGSNPDAGDTPTKESFLNAKSYEAFMEGVNAADGWMECEFVEHLGYHVDKDGFIVAREGRHVPQRNNERYVIWGEYPEPGTRPERVCFETAEEAAMYEEGVRQMVGWTATHMVPFEEFKPCSSMEEALLLLTSEGVQALREANALDEGMLDDDLIFIRPDGAFVKAGWRPGQPIQNMPLSPEEWKVRFDAELRSYGTSVDEAALSPMALAALADGLKARFPELAAQQYAEEKSLRFCPRPAPQMG